VPQTRNSKPFFLLFLGLILAVTTLPPLLGLLGLSFSSPIQGGAGTHFAGLIFGDILIRVDLTYLGFSALIVLLTVLYDRAKSNRFALLLGTTLGISGLLGAVHPVRGMILPEGTVTFFDQIMDAIVVGRFGSVLILAVGLFVIRRGHFANRRRYLIELLVPAGLLVVGAWYAMLQLELTDRFSPLSFNLITLGIYAVVAFMIRKELRHHRLRFFGYSVLASLIPLTVAQLMLTFVVHTVVDDAYHIANLLRGFAWFVPASGLGIDYVNTFYAKGISQEMRYLRSVIDAIPHFIFARDTRGCFTLVNQKVADFYGLKVHEIEGRHLMDVHDDVAQCRTWLAEDKEILQEGAKRVMPESVATDSDGRQIWIHSSKTPLPSLLGINDQVLGVSIDVSERRRAEHALAEALAAAKESSKAKTEFLANMSHEIRTPMNCVIGLTDMLKDMDPNPRQQQYLDMIAISGDTLLSLINDILDISKIEAGQLELDLIDTDLQALVEETAGQIAFAAQAKGLEVICRLAPGVPSRLMLDSARLRQVLTNLLNNAAKFTQSGHIYLNIEPVGERDDRLDLCFRIADTGIGIEQENLRRIFEKFTQAEAGTTRRFGGTGLGLSISKHLINLMEGEITATSQVGVGTTFSFTIPLQPSICDLHPRPASVDAEQRVLVVTDHELGGEVLAEQVRSLGHRCRVAVGSEAAEEAFTREDGQEDWTMVLIDQTFLDSKNPGLQKDINKIPVDCRPEVILLHNLSSLNKDEQLQRLGFDGVLSKPVRLTQLADTLAGRSTALPQITHPDQRSADRGNPDVNPEHGPRILLAEDNPFNQKVAVAMLRLLGCRVDVASNGVEAVDMIDRDRYDLVLMDCQMPVMDGYDATLRIRQRPEPRGDVPIVAMTANSLSGDRKGCFAAGMNDFLSKPVTKDVLRAMLEKWEVLPREDGSPQGSTDPKPVSVPR
jgi:PAS domain S-box-containing protein